MQKHTVTLFNMVRIPEKRDLPEELLPLFFDVNQHQILASHIGPLQIQLTKNDGFSNDEFNNKANKFFDYVKSCGGYIYNVEFHFDENVSFVTFNTSDSWTYELANLSFDMLKIYYVLANTKTLKDLLTNSYLEDSCIIKFKILSRDPATGSYTLESEGVTTKHLCLEMDINNYLNKLIPSNILFYDSDQKQHNKIDIVVAIRLNKLDINARSFFRKLWFKYSFLNK